MGGVPGVLWSFIYHAVAFDVEVEACSHVSVGGNVNGVDIVDELAETVYTPDAFNEYGVVRCVFINPISLKQHEFFT